MATNDTELHYNLVGKTHYGKYSVVFLFVFFFLFVVLKKVVSIIRVIGESVLQI